MKGFAALVLKDLTLELRSGRTTLALASMALLVLVVLVFAFDRTVVRGPEAAAGALWVSLVFAGMLGANRALAVEQEQGCMRGLLLAPLERPTIYAAKLTSCVAFMVAAGAAALVLVVLFFNLDISYAILSLAAVLLLGVFGFSALATLLAIIGMKARGGELLLPVLIVPIFVPALIAGVKASASVLAGAGAARQWLEILVAFDVLFVTAGYLLFEHVLGEE